MLPCCNTWNQEKNRAPDRNTGRKPRSKAVPWCFSEVRHCRLAVRACQIVRHRERLLEKVVHLGCGQSELPFTKGTRLTAEWRESCPRPMSSHSVCRDAFAGGVGAVRLRNATLSAEGRGERIDTPASAA